MKKIISAAAIAVALIGASTGVAEARWHGHHGGWHHHRHCTSWGWHHHHSRFCRGWGW
ncbi:MAG: hypothetical protein WDM91_21300 [Rhizomicrobium sp.]